MWWVVWIWLVLVGQGCAVSEFTYPAHPPHTHLQMKSSFSLEKTVEKDQILSKELLKYSPQDLK
jgi:hypothetical protein